MSMTRIQKELFLYELAKEIDTEPIWGRRSYPDKDCEYFTENYNNGEKMRERIRGLLANKKGYAVQTYNHERTISKYSELPAQGDITEEIPDFINEHSNGWIRIENEFWEWTSDNAVCYICKMNVEISIKDLS